jgi:prepilin-type N-terminal cleavage/methylation domain-containing protein
MRLSRRPPLRRRVRGSPWIAPAGGRSASSAFTLVEIIIVVAMVGILAAIAIPVTVSASRKHAMESAPQLIAQTISRGRDAARDMLRCVTVLSRPAPDGGQVLGAYLHDGTACTNTVVNANDPGANATTVAEIAIDPSAVRTISFLRPSSTCFGVPPPLGCYEPAPQGRFVLRADGTTDLPYRIRLERPEGGIESFLIFPQTGTVRFER